MSFRRSSHSARPRRQFETRATQTPSMLMMQLSPRRWHARPLVSAWSSSLLPMSAAQSMMMTMVTTMACHLFASFQLHHHRTPPSAVHFAAHFSVQFRTPQQRPLFASSTPPQHPHIGVFLSLSRLGCFSLFLSFSQHMFRIVLQHTYSSLLLLTWEVRFSLASFP